MPSTSDRDILPCLAAFMVLARELNFTRAAAAMGVSQSALSHTIKKLEERLGVRLVIRTTRSVGLTNAGKRLVEEAGIHLEEIDRAIAGVSDFRDRLSGMVRIAASDHAAQTVIYPALSGVLREFPDIQLELLVDNALTDLAADQCDAGVRLGEHLAQDMVAVRIGPDQRLAIAGSPDYLSRNGRPDTPDDLINHNCLGVRLETHGNIYAWEFEKNGKEINVRPQGQFVSNDPYQLVNFCVDGIGLACLQESYFEKHLASGKLERVLEDWCDPYTGYYLYYPSRRQPTPAFRVVLDALRRQAAQFAA